MADEFADICGWSEREIINNFRPGIATLSEKREEDFEDTLRTLKEYYDGYLFAPGGSRLYNPFSVLNALDLKEIDPFWFETGTPTFLARWVRNNGISSRRNLQLYETYLHTVEESARRGSL